VETVAVLEVLALALGVVVGAGGIIATIWAVGKVKGVETSIDLLGSANEALRSANEDLRVELAHSERTCAERLARLEGQNAALLDGLGDKLAHAIADRLEPVLTELARSLVDGISQRPEGARTRSTDYAEEIHRRRDKAARDSST
jgi:hypothetical protein